MFHARNDEAGEYAETWWMRSDSERVNDNETAGLRD